MNKIIKILKEQKLLLDMVNVLLGIFVIVLFVLLFVHPDNKYFLIAALFIGGLMNVTNGLGKLRDKKTTVSSYLLFTGAIIIIIAVILILC